MIDLITSLFGQRAIEYVTSLVRSCFSQNDDPRFLKIFTAFEAASNRFFSKYGDEFGDPPNSFIASQANLNIVLKSVFISEPEVTIEALDPNGYCGKPATKEALTFFVKCLNEEKRKDIDLDKMISTKMHFANIMSNNDESIQRKAIEEKVKEYLTMIEKKEIKVIKKKEPFQYSIFAIPIQFGDDKKSLDSIRPIIKVFNRLNNRIILLHGNPACGKTTAINRILRTANKQKIGTPIVPILLDDGLLVSRERVIEETLIQVGLSSSTLFYRLEADHRFLFIYDALNEPPGNANDFAVKIRNLQEKLPHSKFLITCRTFEYNSFVKSSLPPHNAFLIHELNATMQNWFIQNKINGLENQQKVIDALNNEELRIICNNQFIFLMVVDLILFNNIIPKSVCDVYEKFLPKFLTEWEKEKDLESIMHVLKTIAHNMTMNNMVEIPKPSLTNLLKHEDVANIDQIIDKLLKSGLIIILKNNLKFFQQTLLEYLFALFLIDNCHYPKRFTLSLSDLIYDNKLSFYGPAKRFYMELSGLKDLLANQDLLFAWQKDI
jgi:hypothetical protein